MARNRFKLGGVVALTFCLFMSVPFAAGKPEPLYMYTIPEEVEPGYFVADVVTDAQLALHYPQEVLEELRFRLLTPPAMPVAIDEMTGIVTTSGRIDRESVCGGDSSMTSSCRVRVDVAVLPIQYFRIVKMSIEISDVNDNDPEFRPPSIIREMSEASAPGSGFVVPTARDADTPEFGVSRYELTGADDDAGEFFDIRISRKLDGSTEVRLVLTDARLDRETRAEHQLRVTAYDAGEPPRTGHLDVTVIVLDANDNSPVFEYSAYEVTVAENIAVGTVVARVTAHDLDIGLNAEVTYSLGASTQAAYGDVFAVDDVTGDVIVIGVVDHERAPVYHLIVAARDRGPDPLMAEATVVVKVDDVNDIIRRWRPSTR